MNQNTLGKIATVARRGDSVQVCALLGFCNDKLPSSESPHPSPWVPLDSSNSKHVDALLSHVISLDPFQDAHDDLFRALLLLSPTFDTPWQTLEQRLFSSNNRGLSWVALSDIQSFLSDAFTLWKKWLLTSKMSPNTDDTPTKADRACDVLSRLVHGLLDKWKVDENYNESSDCLLETILVGSMDFDKAFGAELVNEVMSFALPNGTFRRWLSLLSLVSELTPEHCNRVQATMVMDENCVESLLPSVLKFVLNHEKVNLRLCCLLLEQSSTWSMRDILKDTFSTMDFKQLFAWVEACRSVKLGLNSGTVEIVMAVIDTAQQIMTLSSNREDWPNHYRRKSAVLVISSCWTLMRERSCCFLRSSWNDVAGSLTKLVYRREGAFVYGNSRAESSVSFSTLYKTLRHGSSAGRDGRRNTDERTSIWIRGCLSSLYLTNQEQTRFSQQDLIFCALFLAFLYFEAQNYQDILILELHRMLRSGKWTLRWTGFQLYGLLARTHAVRGESTLLPLNQMNSMGDFRKLKLQLEDSSLFCKQLLSIPECQQAVLDYCEVVLLCGISLTNGRLPIQTERKVERYLVAIFETLIELACIATRKPHAVDSLDLCLRSISHDQSFMSKSAQVIAYKRIARACKSPDITLKVLEMLSSRMWFYMNSLRTKDEAGAAFQTKLSGEDLVGLLRHSMELCSRVATEDDIQRFNELVIKRETMLHWTSRIDEESMVVSRALCFVIAVLWWFQSGNFVEILLQSEDGNPLPLQPKVIFERRSYNPKLETRLTSMEDCHFRVGCYFVSTMANAATTNTPGVLWNVLDALKRSLQLFSSLDITRIDCESLCDVLLVFARLSRRALEKQGIKQAMRPLAQGVVPICDEISRRDRKSRALSRTEIKTIARDLQVELRRLYMAAATGWTEVVDESCKAFTKEELLRTLLITLRWFSYYTGSRGDAKLSTTTILQEEVAFALFLAQHVREHFKENEIELDELPSVRIGLDVFETTMVELVNQFHGRNDVVGKKPLVEAMATLYHEVTSMMELKSLAACRIFLNAVEPLRRLFLFTWKESLQNNKKCYEILLSTIVSVGRSETWRLRKCDKLLLDTMKSSSQWISLTMQCFTSIQPTTEVIEILRPVIAIVLELLQINMKDMMEVPSQSSTVHVAVLNHVISLLQNLQGAAAYLQKYVSCKHERISGQEGAVVLLGSWMLAEEMQLNGLWLCFYASTHDEKTLFRAHSKSAILWERASMMTEALQSQVRDLLVLSLSEEEDDSRTSAPRRMEIERVWRMCVGGRNRSFFETVKRHIDNIPVKRREWKISLRSGPKTQHENDNTSTNKIIQTWLDLDNKLNDVGNRDRFDDLEDFILEG